MSDIDEMRAELATIVEPKAMLAYLLKNADFLGYDPYYKDLRKAMLKRAEELAR